MPPPCDQQPTPQADGEAAANDEPHTRLSVTFTLVLVAEAAALSVIRDRLRRWLRANRWPADELDDLVLAVTEAAANVVEHAYPPDAPGNIEIDGRVTGLLSGGREIEITVRDRGRWRPIPDRPENRRRGIPLMRAALAELVIHGTNQGTMIVMRSRCVGQ